ncbi:MAG: serine/threonine-protein kinase [Sandaracinaceae bacterium]
MKPGFPVVVESPPAEEADPWVGRTLSNVYVIEEKIGEGGMGSVYVARHVHLEKRFAVKVLVESVAGKNNAVDRLKQEAMAAANIDHENIVDVVNFDRTEEGAVFIVMEFLKGESLADTLGRGPLELHYALPITYQICRALHAAHEHGIVHRDLKPENVFLTERRGRTVAKILDFGISKVKKAESEQVRMTKTGQLVGTPLYMSPEQARGETDIDRRVDIYAMGVMLYEALAGKLPYEASTVGELFVRIGSGEHVPLEVRRPDLDAAWYELVHKAFHKDRAQRYQSAEELRRALLPLAEPRLATRAKTISEGTRARGTLGYEEAVPPPPRAPAELVHSRDAETVLSSSRPPPAEPPPPHAEAEADEEQDEDENPIRSAPPPPPARAAERGSRAWLWALGGAALVGAILIPWRFMSTPDPVAPPPPVASPGPPSAEDDPAPAPAPTLVDDEAPAVAVTSPDAGAASEAPVSSGPHRRGTPASAAGLDPNPYR